MKIQTQLTINLPEQIVGLLKMKADRLGVSITEFIKIVVTKEVEEKKYPTFKASKATIRAAKQAMKDYEAGKAVIVDDVHALFESKNYPVYKISKRSERKTIKALQEKNKAVDASVFFKMLHNEG